MQGMKSKNMCIGKAQENCEIHQWASETFALFFLKDVGVVQAIQTKAHEAIDFMAVIFASD